jgi:hypothetical protein
MLQRRPCREISRTQNRRAASTARRWPAISAKTSKQCSWARKRYCPIGLNSIWFLPGRKVFFTPCATTSSPDSPLSSKNVSHSPIPSSCTTPRNLSIFSPRAIGSGETSRCKILIRWPTPQRTRPFGAAASVCATMLVATPTRTGNSILIIRLMSSLPLTNGGRLITNLPQCQLT